MIFRINPVAVKVVETTADIQLHPMRQVSTLSQIQSQDMIAWFQTTQIHGGIGLRATVGLHIGGLGTKKLPSPLKSDILDNIDDQSVEESVK